MFEIIKDISTPLMLFAFAVAAVVQYLRHRNENRMKTINLAPAKDRAQLIESTIRDFGKVNTESLTESQKFQLVLELIEERKNKYSFSIAAAIIVALAFMIFIAYIYLNDNRHTTETISSKTTIEEDLNKLLGEDQWFCFPDYNPTQIGVRRLPKNFILNDPFVEGDMCGKTYHRGETIPGDHGATLRLSLPINLKLISDSTMSCFRKPNNGLISPSSEMFDSLFGQGNWGYNAKCPFAITVNKLQFDFVVKYPFTAVDGNNCLKYGLSDYVPRFERGIAVFWLSGNVPRKEGIPVIDCEPCCACDTFTSIAASKGPATTGIPLSLRKAEAFFSAELYDSAVNNYFEAARLLNSCKYDISKKRLGEFYHKQNQDSSAACEYHEAFCHLIRNVYNHALPNR